MPFRFKITYPSRVPAPVFSYSPMLDPIWGWRVSLDSKAMSGTRLSQRRASWSACERDAPSRRGSTLDRRADSAIATNFCNRQLKVHVLKPAVIEKKQSKKVNLWPNFVASRQYVRIVLKILANDSIEEDLKKFLIYSETWSKDEGTRHDGETKPVRWLWFSR